MSKYVEITSVTGSSPYNIYICDVDLISCTWITTITSGDLPYSFELPFIFLLVTYDTDKDVLSFNPPINKEIINDIVASDDSNFLSTKFIF